MNVTTTTSATAYVSLRAVHVGATGPIAAPSNGMGGFSAPKTRFDFWGYSASPPGMLM